MALDLYHYILLCRCNYPTIMSLKYNYLVTMITKRFLSKNELKFVFSAKVQGLLDSFY